MMLSWISDGDMWVAPSAGRLGRGICARAVCPDPVPRAAIMIDMPLDERVFTALERNPYVSRRNLRFETADGRVTLRGIVGTYFQKQMAQEAIRHVAGVDEIANELEVCWS
jgi:osmotically-inducible protein OsmY